MNFKKFISLSLIAAFALSFFSAFEAYALSDAGGGKNCAAQLERLDELFFDQEDDFPTEVNRAALFDFLTVENKVIFSKIHLEAVEAVVGLHGLGVAYATENFKLLRPTEINVLATDIWGFMVRRAQNLDAADKAPVTNIELTLRQRVGLGQQFYEDIIRFKEIILAIEANPMLKKETVSLIGATLETSLKIIPLSLKSKKIISWWKRNNGGWFTWKTRSIDEAGWLGRIRQTGLSKLSLLNGVSMALGTFTTVGLAATGASPMHVVEAAGLATAGVPATYTAIQWSRSAYNRASAAIRKQITLKSVKKQIPKLPRN